MRGTTNEEAYRLYLQGMYLAGNRSSWDARKAVEVLEQAVRLDPNYAHAAGLNEDGWLNAGESSSVRVLGVRTQCGSYEGSRNR
jgi:hypothetical protein